MLKPQVNPSIPLKPNAYAGTLASSSKVFGSPSPQPYRNTEQIVPQTTASLPSNQFQEERFDYENWDFTNGYYDESGNFVPYQGYYDESGNFVPTETAPTTEDGYQYYDSQSAGHAGDSVQLNSYDNTNYYSPGPVDLNSKKPQVQPQYSEDYPYDENEQEGFDPYYYTQEDEEYPEMSKLAGTKESAFHAAPSSRQPSIQSQPSIEYNYAYESSENLPSAFDKSKPVPPASKMDLDRANSVIRRQSFRRQASTRDYGLDGGRPETLGLTQGPLSKVTKPNYPYKPDVPSVHHSLSLDDAHYDDGWTSQEFVDADPGTMRTNSYDHYEDAVEEQDVGHEGISAEGPVHMDSLESNTSEPGVRDRDANEKFEAQYWQRQRERIAEQATLCSQDSQDYYDYEPYEGPNQNQHPQRLESIDEVPFSPPPSSSSGVAEKSGIGRQGSETEWRTGSRSARSSLDTPVDRVNRHGSLKMNKREVRRELSRQETLEGQPDVADEEYLGEYDEDEIGHPFMRKHSSVSVDSQGETLPPTSPIPSEHKSESQQLSMDMEDDSVTERKASLDTPGKDKGAKSVSFEPEPPKVMIPERHTKGMTSKEKWLWSMNRICSTLQVTMNRIKILKRNWRELIYTHARARRRSSFRVFFFNAAVPSPVQPLSLSIFTYLIQLRTFSFEKSI